MRCPECGANIEVTEFENGFVLVRQDCLCDIRKLTKKEDTPNE